MFTTTMKQLTKGFSRRFGQSTTGIHHGAEQDSAIFIVFINTA